MAPRQRLQRQLSVPAGDAARSSRGISVGDRSDQGDDSSEHQDASGQQDRAGPARKRASRPKVRTAKQVSRADRPLLPRPKLAALASSKGPSSLQPASAQLPLLISPGLGLDLNDDEGWYFSLYRNKVAQDLSPCFNDNFWSRFTLRDSMSRKSIRHSILSIGAYAKALAELKSEHPLLHAADRPWWPVSVVNRHREAALTHHAQALAWLRQEIHANGVDNRATMVATLLFIVFENMMGNYHSSGNLIRSGIKVLNNMSRTRSRKFVWRTYCGAFEPPDEIDEMAHIFLRHSTSTVYLPFPHGKSAYHMLFEDDDTNPLNDTGDNISVLFSTQTNIPRTPEHARAVWETIYSAIGKFYAKAVWRNLNPNYEIDDDAFIDQALLVTRLHDFGTGIAALMLADHDDRTDRGLKFLEVHHLVATILVSCCLDRTEVSYDKFAPQFMDLVEKFKALSRRRAFPNGSGFSNEVGMLPLFAFVASKCRIHSVRVEVLELLRNSSWREGSWDGISLANAVNNLMELEGQSDQNVALGGFMPPPEMRYIWTNMFWDFENRRMTMEYTRAWSNEPSDFEKVIRVVSG
ncbi:GAL4 domain-containing protein [Seiridium cupressi]